MTTHLIALGVATLCAPGGAAASCRPEIVTSDVENFWRAFDAAAASGQWVSEFQRHYWTPGSAGVRAFPGLGTVPELALEVSSRPNFYRSIRSATLAIAANRGALEEAVVRYCTIFRRSGMPRVYLVMGGGRSIGTATPEGAFVALEGLARTESADTSELDAGRAARLREPGDTASFVVHEVAHYYQKAGKGTYLERCLLEGAADFAAEMAVGRRVPGRPDEWAAARRGWIFHRLRSGPVAEAPQDLDYWIGREIAASYYRRQRDKRKALDRLATLAKPKDIVKGSEFGYLARAKSRLL